MSTIKDVAKEAGVSTATVSRVLNNNYPVHMDTRKRVMEAVEKLNFTLNAVARGLKMKETYLIGLVSPDISNPFFMDMAKGIESVVSGVGYNLIFCSTDEDEEKENKMLTMLHEKQVDAVILATRASNSRRINELVQDGMKLVMVDTKLENAQADLVYENSYQAAYDAIEYGILKGHRRILMINGIMSVSTAKERFRAYLDVLASHHIPFDETLVISGGFNRDVTCKAMTHFLQQDTWKKNPPTMIFSANNYMTEGAMIALKTEQIQIPQDVSLISFGDLSVPQLVDPILTYVVQTPYEMGKEAGVLLLARLRNELEPFNYRTEMKRLFFSEGQSVINILK